MGNSVGWKRYPAWLWTVPLAWTFLVGMALWWNSFHLRGASPALAQPVVPAKDYPAAQVRRLGEVLAHAGVWAVGLLAFGAGARQIQRRQHERDQAEEGLRIIGTSFAHLSGKPFFEAASRHLAMALGVDYVFVGELSSKHDSVTALGGWAQGEALQELTYELAGTPCENVLATTSCVYASGVQSLFPKDRLLAEMGIEGYLGATIFDKQRQPLGLLVALHSKPLTRPAAITNLFSAFAERVSAEMQRRQAQTAAEKGEERMRLFFERQLVGMAITSPDTGWVQVNDRLCQMLGYSRKEITDVTWTKLTYPEDLPADELQYGRVLAGEIDDYSLEKRLVRKDGTLIHCDFSLACVRRPDRSVEYLLTLLADISDRKRAEAALRESERKYRELVENANSIILRWNPNGEITFLNEFGQRFFGWSQEEILTRNVVGTIVPETESTGRDLRQLINLICEQPLSYQRNLNENVLRDGRRVWIAWTNKAVFGREGNLLEVLSVGTDVTERREAEQALSESEARYRTLFATNPHPMWVYDLETLAFLEVNEAAVSHYGYSREEFLGMTITAIRPPEDVPRLLQKVAEANSGLDKAGVWRHCKKDGSLIEVEITSHGLEYRGRRAELVLANDITERRQAEARYRSLFDNALEGIYQTNEEGTILAANPSLARMLGYASPEELIREVRDLGPGLYADPVKRDEFRRTLEEQGAVTGFEHELVRSDGTRIWVSGNARAIRDEQGHVAHYEGSMEDISERKRAEQERQRLLAQLVQAQKMEAVGQLAGGVAHDFNNILASIILHAGLLRLHPSMTAEVRNALSELETEAARAANLTRQLLMFSRRQRMQPQVVDFNSLIGDLLKMLRRLIGEHISLEFKSSPAALWVKADAGMLEQVIVNLVVNARDAMPQGGCLTIATDKVLLDESYVQQNPEGRPGQFACLSVSDTGSGMDEATIERIFEPFFTTKEPGKGTGLGLATVYGIVQQHHGWVQVESTVGHGSAFRVYLPPESGGTDKLRLLQTEEQSPGGHETLLVVEDEAAVRGTIVRALRERGYTVLEASDGLSALELWLQSSASIHLLVTDMVMPRGLSGLDLAERLRRDNRQLKVLLISGYNVELAQHGLPAHANIAYLAKPFTVRALAEAVRSCLDSNGDTMANGAAVSKQAGALPDPSI